VHRLLRHLVPWLVSGLALVWVFGFKTDWKALLAATSHADVPRFVAIQAADKLVFFTAWALVQAAAIRAFVLPIPVRSVISIRGGAELVRAVHNSLGDGLFLVGISRLARGRTTEILAATTLPFACHFVVLLSQATLSLLLSGAGSAGNRDVAWSVGIGWVVLAVGLVGLRTRRSFGWLSGSGLGALLDRMSWRRLLPFFGALICMAGLDVLIQGLAVRSFGLSIPWLALAARIPLLYAALSLPSFGSFGTRELGWAAAFSGFAPHDALIAYAFATNAIFLVMNIVVGGLFLPRAIELVAQLRRAESRGEAVPEPLLHDAVDP
jgi:hypothetical protein